MIRFNVPYISGKELEYIADAMSKGHLAGDGDYSALCRKFFSDKFHFHNNYLTTSGTDALEMAAILAGIQPGDEVIMPSFTFVSTANAFILRGAKVIFTDSLAEQPNMDHTQLEELITSKTRVIVPVHYGGVACEMDYIKEIAQKNQILVIEDAAHALGATYKGRPLGGIGNFGAFSFHETKNIISGEGGLLVVGDGAFTTRAEIIREKGTNRTAFFRGEIDKYGWVDIGSSFLPSEITVAFLYAQLECIDQIQQMRVQVWGNYFAGLKLLPEYGYQLPVIPPYASNNGHLFYMLCPSLEKRTALIKYLSLSGIKAVFHYQPLHNSAFYTSLYPENKKTLPNTERYGDVLVRLPLYPGLSESNQEFIIQKILEFVSQS